MVYLTEKKQAYITAYRNVECELLQMTGGKCSTLYFLQNILCVLRMHPQLCEQEDYKKLYDETIVLLILHAYAEKSWDQIHPDDPVEWFERIADQQNNRFPDLFQCFMLETVDGYLAFRKSAWQNGNYYTVQRYDLTI